MEKVIKGDKYNKMFNLGRDCRCLIPLWSNNNLEIWRELHGNHLCLENISNWQDNINFYKKNG